MTVTYEWDVETVDEHGDIVDHWHDGRLAPCLARAATAPEPGCTHRVVLVRDDDDERTWAELDGGRLPERFEDAAGHPCGRVPQRFHREAARAAQQRSAT